MEPDFLNPSRALQLYGEEIAKNPELGEVLETLVEVGDIRNAMRAALETDDPVELEKQLGKTIQGNTVTQETVDHAQQVSREYHRAYDRYKELLSHMVEQS